MTKDILAIDPGTTHSAWLWLMDGEIRSHDYLNNKFIVANLHGCWSLEDTALLAIEDVGHYGTGMPAGKEVFETCIWIGRFIQAWSPRAYHRLHRKTVCSHICGSARAKDPHIRQALIDRYGGLSEAIGGRKCQVCKGKGWQGRGRAPCVTCEGAGLESPQGPLHSVSGHGWSALAIALTARDTAEVVAAAPEPAG